MMRYGPRAILGLAAVLIIHSGCVKHRASVDARASGQHTFAEKLNDGWETADSSGANFDAELIKNLIGRIKDNSYQNIHSIVVVKNGKIIVEEYFPGREEDGQYRAYQRGTLHGIHSATKSIIPCSSGSRSISN